MVVVHFILDCIDAMGANMVNTIAEALAPTIAAITGEHVGLESFQTWQTSGLHEPSPPITSELRYGRAPGDVVAENRICLALCLGRPLPSYDPQQGCDERNRRINHRDWQ